MFDPRTRENIETNLEEFGGALAGRGSALNRSIGALPELLRDLVPVMQTLSDPDTQLVRALRELDDAARVSAPVADKLARGFTAGADVFEALSRDPEALKATIAESPAHPRRGHPVPAGPAPVAARAHRHLRRAARNRPPGAPERPGPQPRAGRRHAACCAAPRRLNRDLTEALRALRDAVALAHDEPRARRPARDVRDAQPDAALRRPARHRVQLLQLLVDVPRRPHLRGGHHRHAAAHPGQERAAADQRPGRRSAPSSPPTGRAPPATRPRTTIFGDPAYLHNQQWGRAVDEQGNADCETGQRGYPRAPRRPGAAQLQDRHRRAHPRQPGPDVHGQAPRTARPDLLGRAHGARTPGDAMNRRDRDPFKVGAVVLAVIVLVTWLGFTKNIPFVNDPYEIQAAFRDCERAQAQLAGPHRRRERRQGHLGRARRRRLAGGDREDGASRTTAGRSTPTRGPRSGRGSSWRATSSSSWSPGPRRPRSSTPTTTIPVQRTATPVQFDQLLSILQARHPPGPARHVPRARRHPEGRRRARVPALAARSGGGLPLRLGRRSRRCSASVTATSATGCGARASWPRRSTATAPP